MSELNDFSDLTGPTPVQDLRVVLDDIHDTEILAATLAAELRAGDVMILTGELGAGKTTLTQAIARNMGITDPITSPTFVIARNHQNPTGGPALVHVDAYRLDSQDALASLDLESTQDQSITIIEWGRGLAEELGRVNGWLDVELIRPSVTDATGTQPIITDFSDEETAEPRVARIRAYGDRYDKATLMAVELTNNHHD